MSFCHTSRCFWSRCFRNRIVFELKKHLSIVLSRRLKLKSLVMNGTLEFQTLLLLYVEFHTGFPTTRTRVDPGSQSFPTTRVTECVRTNTIHGVLSKRTFRNLVVSFFERFYARAVFKRKFHMLPKATRLFAGLRQATTKSARRRQRSHTIATMGSVHSSASE